MRALALPTAGSQPSLVDIPDPTPATGQVLVKVAASSVNGFDAAVAAGHLAGMMEHRYPVVLGKDFAGTVVAIGQDVTRFAVGEAVFGVVTKAYLGDGGMGELLVVDAEHHIAAVPEGVPMATAGALGLAGATALDALAAVGVFPAPTAALASAGSSADPAADRTSGTSGTPGASTAPGTVLISGATGGVGTLAVQYAASAGATVIATARPGADADLVTDLGAAHVVDHTADLPTQVRAIAPGGVDAVLHLAGRGPELVQLLTQDGRLASVLGYSTQDHPAATYVMANPTAVTLQRLAADVATSSIRVSISKTFTLQRADQALLALGEHPRGKISIVVV